MKLQLERILLYILTFAILIPAVGISGGANIMSGNYNKEDDNRLLYMFKNESGCYETNKVIVIKSLQKLKDYYEENYRYFDFDNDRLDAKYYDIKNFRDIVFCYHDNWFKNNMLYLIVTVEATDYYYYRLKTIDYRFIIADIVLFRDKPRENATNTPVVWLTFLELDKKSLISFANVRVVDKA